MAAAQEIFVSTRANCDRFAFLLVRAGHVPGHSLGHLDFRVLLFLLGQRPGQYAAHHRTMAAACNSNTTSIKESLHRLRTAGLVTARLLRPRALLPFGGHRARTNINQYDVNLSGLATLLELPVARRKEPSSMGPESAPSAGRNSASSPRTIFHLNKTTPPNPPSPNWSPERDSEALQGKAISKKPSDREPDLGTAAPKPPGSFSAKRAPSIECAGSPDLELVRQAWDQLDLGPVNPRVLENRRIEGATVERLEAAVAGAREDEWLRRRAKVPFAVVFASLASVERFAHEGRKRMDAEATKRQQDADRHRDDLAWRAQQRACEDRQRSPSLEELRKTLPPMDGARAQAKPLSASELDRRRAQQLADAARWVSQDGVIAPRATTPPV